MHENRAQASTWERGSAPVSMRSPLLYCSKSSPCSTIHTAAGATPSGTTSGVCAGSGAGLLRVNPLFWDPAARDFRLELAGNVLRKFYYDVAGQA